MSDDIRWLTSLKAYLRVVPSLSARTRCPVGSTSWIENAVRVLVKMKTVVPVKPFPVVTDDVLRLALLDFPIIVLEAFDGVG